MPLKQLLRFIRGLPKPRTGNTRNNPPGDSHYPFTIDKFVTVHREARNRLDRYIDMDRRGFARLDGWAKQMMSPQAARNLYANNVESRIAVARLLLEHGLPFLQSSGPLFFVTVVSRAYVLPRGRAGEIDLFSLQQLTRALTYLTQ